MTQIDGPWQKADITEAATNIMAGPRLMPSANRVTSEPERSELFKYAK